MEMLHVKQIFNASIGEVFDYFSDHENVGELFPGETLRIKKGSNPDFPNGLGSVWRITVFPITVEETITEFIPNKLIEYRISNDAPIRNHLGKMEFSELNGKTVLDYSIEFESKVPYLGKVVKLALEEALIFGLKKQSEKYN